MEFESGHLFLDPKNGGFKGHNPRGSRVVDRITNRPTKQKTKQDGCRFNRVTMSKSNPLLPRALSLEYPFSYNLP